MHRGLFASAYDLDFRIDRTTAPARSAGHRISASRQCSPCFLRECPLDFRCMHAVTSAEIVGAIQNMISRADPAESNNIAFTPMAKSYAGMTVTDAPRIRTEVQVMFSIPTAVNCRPQHSLSALH